MSIPYEARRAVYDAAFAANGKDLQIWKAIEEMAELTNEIAKFKGGDYRNRHGLVDEIADVTIMMEQLRLMFGLNEAVQARIDFKVRRLAARLGVASKVDDLNG